MTEGKTEKAQKQIPVRENLFIQPADPQDSPKLILSRCRECGGRFYPKEEMCPACIKEGTLETIAVEGKGKLVAFTKVRRSPPGFDSPYAIASVKLDDGPVLIAQLQDWQDIELKIDMPVRFLIGKIKEDRNGNVIIGPKFKPLRG